MWTVLIRCMVVVGAAFLTYWSVWSVIAVIAGFVRESRAYHWRQHPRLNDKCYYTTQDGNRIPCRFIGWMNGKSFPDIAQVATPLGLVVVSIQALYPNVRSKNVPI